MTIAFAPDACIKHPSISLLRLLLAGVLLAGPGCGAPVSTTLEQRPTGAYGQVLSWSGEVGEVHKRHRVEVEIEIDAAQLLGWAATTHAYAAFLDVRIEGEGAQAIEEIVPFPVTEEREVGRDENTVQIAYLAAGTVQPSGFRRSERRRAFSFVPGPGTVTLSAHLRTPSGADRRALRAIRAVRLIVSGRDGVVTDWQPLPMSIRKE